MDVIKDMITLGDGNYGAITLMGELFMMDIPGIELIQILTKLEIKGLMLWLLYNQVCSHNLKTLSNILLAFNNGKLDKDIIIYAINNNHDGIYIRQ